MRFNIYTGVHQEILDTLNLGGIRVKLLERTTWNIKGALSWMYVYEMGFGEEKFKADVFLADMSSTLTVTQGQSKAVYEKLNCLFEKDSEYGEPDKEDEDNSLITKIISLLATAAFLSPAAYGVYNILLK